MSRSLLQNSRLWVAILVLPVPPKWRRRCFSISLEVSILFARCHCVIHAGVIIKTERWKLRHNCVQREKSLICCIVEWIRLLDIFVEDIASISLSSCVEPERGCIYLAMGVCSSVSWRTASVLSLTRVEAWIRHMSQQPSGRPLVEQALLVRRHVTMMA